MNRDPKKMVRGFVFVRDDSYDSYEEYMQYLKSIQPMYGEKLNPDHMNLHATERARQRKKMFGSSYAAAAIHFLDPWQKHEAPRADEPERKWAVRHDKRFNDYCG